MIDESWFHAGEAELRAIVSGGEAHAQAKGSNRRFGLIDAVILYWGKIPEAELAERRDYYERASAQQDIVVRQGHVRLAGPEAAENSSCLASRKATRKDDRQSAQERSGPGRRPHRHDGLGFVQQVVVQAEAPGFVEGREGRG